MSLRLSANSVWNSKTGKLYEPFLYDTQMEVLNESNKNQILELGTSSGKTFISLHLWARHSKAPLLIIAPRAKVDEKGWERSIEHFKNYYDTDFDYHIETPDMIKKKWRKFKGWYLIVDECHMVKGSTNQRGKAIYQLSQIVDGFCLLSATPISNGWEDSVNYFKLFGKTKNKTQFEKRFAVKEMQKLFSGRQFPKIVGWHEEEILKKWWNEISIKRETSYFVDLPEKVEEFVEFKKSTFYKQLEKDRLIEYGNGEIEPLDTLPKLNAARRKHGNAKEKLKHLEMLLETDENILIFYNFDKERDEIYQLLERFEKKVYEVSGHRKEIPDESIWSGLKNAVSLVQYKAGGAGIELQYNQIMVIYSATYSSQDHIQALGRAHRLGGHRLIVYKYKVKGTIDTAIYNALEQKQDFKDELYREEAGDAILPQQS